MAEHKLSFTANEIDERLRKIDSMGGGSLIIEIGEDGNSTVSFEEALAAFNEGKILYLSAGMGSIPVVVPLSYLKDNDCFVWNIILFSNTTEINGCTYVLNELGLTSEDFGGTLNEMGGPA